MIQKLTLKNFRNFSDRSFSFWEVNYISGFNGAGKTNILEALSLFSEPILDIDFSLLVNKWEEVLYLEILLSDGKKVSISYDKTLKKKKYLINGKTTTKKKIKEVVPGSVAFHPLAMNLMYLWPSKRRSFLDQILANTFPNYSTVLKKYKKIVISRNRVLKNISEGKSSRSEIEFWNQSFLEASCLIYKYREVLVAFFESRANDFKKFFSGKVQNVTFKYITKIDRTSTKKSIQKYLDTHLERDILLRKTYIWPHIDDFDILLDTTSLIGFASRWEVKSTIIALKFLESEFYETHAKRKPIFLVDDILSELDEIHKNMIFWNMRDSQTFITSIKKLNQEWKIIEL